MATIAYAAALTVIWILAWGTLSFANVVGGLAVAVLLLTIAPDTWPRRGAVRVRPVAIARYVGFVIVDAAIANLHLVRDVLMRNPRVSTGVVAVPLPLVSDGLLTVITNTIALSPGTMPIEVDYGEPTVLYVHFLRLDDPEVGRRSIQRLAGRAYGAFGSDEAITAFRASCRQGEESSP